MRTFSMLSAILAAAFFAICTANAESGQSKMLKIASPDLVRPIDAAQSNDATGRFLRLRQDDEVFETEERGFGEASVKKAARSIIQDAKKADRVYEKWYDNKGYSLNTIANYLKIGEKGKEKYNPVYNGYMAYRNSKATRL